ncbi:Mitochondrial dicarboxylate transporter [Tulasnella sp. 330]|nr:Mitochondrial dicarboxylate transporter [Tulasnella sp. 330]
MSATSNVQISPALKKKQPYPIYLGGIAASIAASITHPLDLTKVRLQASGDSGMIQSLRKTVRTAGVRGLFDGVSATLFRQMTYSMCRFWAYDESKKILKAGPNSPAWKLATAGAMAGSIAGVVGNPGEILMVRMQGDFAKAPEKRLNYKNCFDGLFRMIREEGVSSLTRGIYPNVIRSMLMNASQLAAYDWSKSILLKTKYFGDNIYCHFTASLFAGTVATTVCSPADVLKSRVMNASGPGSSSTIAVLKKSFKNEGPMFMFKGVMMREQDADFTVRELESDFPTQILNPPGPTRMQFEIIAQCRTTRARVSRMTLAHGTTILPTFMPVATQAAIKGLTPQQTEELGITLLLNNTYHLNLRPGKQVLDAVGGAHVFQGWRKNMLTTVYQDSGGFQMVSLASFSEVTEEGVLFASPFTGEPTMLTPEESMRIQAPIS